jgi:transcriptional regulator GlxA family with amidase domain
LVPANLRPRQCGSRRRSVGLSVGALLDVTGPLQVFVCANDHVAQAGGTPPYVLRVVAKDGRGVTTSAGLGIVTSPLQRTGTPPDTLIVAGGPGVDAAAADTGLVDWIRQRTYFWNEG